MNSNIGPQPVHSQTTDFNRPGSVAHDYIPSTQETEQADLCEFKATFVNTVRDRLETKGILLVVK